MYICMCVCVYVYFTYIHILFISFRLKTLKENRSEKSWVIITWDVSSWCNLQRAIVCRRPHLFDIDILRLYRSSYSRIAVEYYRTFISIGYGHKKRLQVKYSKIIFYFNHDIWIIQFINNQWKSYIKMQYFYQKTKNKNTLLKPISRRTTLFNIIV